MKVVCESCQAKYQVPDERVAGKKLKIRCKRCGATVLIRGDLVAGSTSHEQFSSPPESLAPIETSSQETAGFEWHVSLDGDTRGPFTLDEVRAWLSSTVGGWEAHVWHEGFPDWIDARACAELEPPALPAESAAANAFAAGGGMGGLHSDELPTQTFQAPGAHQSAQFFAEMSGVSGTGHSSSAGARQASSLRLRPVSGYGDVAPARANASLNHRSDESVVFSQSGLQTMTGNAASAPAPSYTPGPNPGFASGEGSGLIDIRALASLARQSTTQIAPGGVPSPRSSGPRNTRDTHDREMGALSFGTDDDHRGLGGSAFARVDSLAPVSTGQTSNAALPLAILGGCALVAAAVLAAVLFNRPARPAEVVSGQAQMQESLAAAAQPPNSAEPAIAPKVPEPTNDATRNQAPSGDEPASAVAREDEGEDDSDELAAGKSKRQPRMPHTAVEEKKSGATPEEKTKPKREKDEKPEQLPDSPETMLAERARPVKQTPQPAAPPAPESPVVTIKDERPKASSGTDIDSLLAAKPAARPAQKGGSMDDLLNGAVKPPAPAATVAAAPVADGASDLPDSPSRDETLAAMRGVEAAVRACATAGEPLTGTADVSISVAGTTGRVTSATVTGITGNVGSCIARAVRGARFPHFTKPVFSIKYPYRF